MSSVRSLTVLSHYSSFLAKRHPGQSSSQFSGLLMSRFSFSVIVNVSLTSYKKIDLTMLLLKLLSVRFSQIKRSVAKIRFVGRVEFLYYCSRNHLWRRSCDGRVVMALDLKSNGVSPRRFESCSQRLYFFRTFLRNKKHCIGLCWLQKRDKRKTRPWGKKIKNTTSFKISFPVSKSHWVLFHQSDSVLCDQSMSINISCLWWPV